MLKPTCAHERSRSDGTTVWRTWAAVLLIQSRRSRPEPVSLSGSQYDCQACPLKPKCCPNMIIRKIDRSPFEPARDVARALAKTATYRHTPSRFHRHRVFQRIGPEAAVAHCTPEQLFFPAGWLLVMRGMDYVRRDSRHILLPPCLSFLPRSQVRAITIERIVVHIEDTRVARALTAIFAARAHGRHGAGIVVVR